MSEKIPTERKTINQPTTPKGGGGQTFRIYS